MGDGEFCEFVLFGVCLVVVGDGEKICFEVVCVGFVGVEVDIVGDGCECVCVV